MEIFVDLLKEVNIIQIFILLVAGWAFYNRLNTKIDKVEANLNTKIDKIEGSLNDRIDKLGEKVEDVDRRLCRIEGSLSTHGHCLFNQAKPEQKAQ